MLQTNYLNVLLHKMGAHLNKSDVLNDLLVFLADNITVIMCPLAKIGT